ncbi:MAG: tetratricopeptide repeat protein [Candidatus Eisenbacteria bacterium]|nr:tetratricopeptide repeat protein [Candidatus Eisenbacteria bacterium]
MPDLGELLVVGVPSVKKVILLSIGLLVALQSLAGAQELAKAWELLGKGERDRAREIATSVLASSQDQKARGEALLIQGLCEENGKRALGLLERFVSEFPGHPLRWRAETELGLHYYALGSYLGAVKHFEKARDLKPSKRERVTAVYWLGLSLEGAGDPAKAIPHFEAVKADDAGTGLVVPATLGVGDCLRAEGNYSLALSEYTRIVTKFGRSDWLPCALYGAGVCLDKLGRQNEALALYARLRREFPATSEATLVRERTRDAGKAKAVSTQAGNYTLQLGAFSQETNANGLASLLRDEGVTEVVIVQEERGGRVLYVVGLGDFPTREAAERKGKELRARLGLSYSIVAK